MRHDINALDVKMRWPPEEVSAQGRWTRNKVLFQREVAAQCVRSKKAGRYLAHKLLGGEDEFVVDEPARPVLEQTAVRMGVHRLLVLHRLVRAARLREARRVVEEPGRHRLKDRGK